jgi:hypothetical protein
VNRVWLMELEDQHLFTAQEDLTVADGNRLLNSRERSV